MMKKCVLSNQTGFLSGQNLLLAGQMTCLSTKGTYLQARHLVLSLYMYLDHEMYLLVSRFVMLKEICVVHIYQYVPATMMLDLRSFQLI